MHIHYSNIKWDVIVFTETNLKDDEVQLYNMDDYDKISVCRQKSRGGGILIFIKKNKFNNVKYEINKLDVNDIIKITMEMNSEVFNLVAIYRKPSSSRLQFLKELQ